MFYDAILLRTHWNNEQKHSDTAHTDFSLKHSIFIDLSLHDDDDDDDEYLDINALDEHDQCDLRTGDVWETTE